MLLPLKAAVEVKRRLVPAMLNLAKEGKRFCLFIATIGEMCVNVSIFRFKQPT